MPDDLTPDELTVDKALELLAAPKTDEPIGELDGLPGVRQERSLRAVRAVGRRRTTCRPGSTSRRCRACSRRWSSSGSRWTRPRRCCSCRARSAPTRPTARRSSPTTAATGRTCRRARTSATSSNEDAAVHDHARRGAARSSPSRRCSAAAGRTWRPRVRCASSARPGQRRAGRRQGRQVRRVRHRRRDERLDRQGRPPRGDAARAGLRAAGGPPRAGRRQGRRRRRSRQEGRRPRSAGEEAGEDEGRRQDAA